MQLHYASNPLTVMRLEAGNKNRLCALWRQAPLLAQLLELLYTAFVVVHVRAFNLSPRLERIGKACCADLLDLVGVFKPTPSRQGAVGGCAGMKSEALAIVACFANVTPLASCPPIAGAWRSTILANVLPHT